ncbi:MAG: 2-oxo acid dehydrogenase subunit E2 [Phycisphaerales bacterium]|nr:2-oxo acid dehydrogenase subunit E2 [Phycisphaerales bacterium]
MSQNSTFEFKLPDLGEGVHEGRVLKLHVAEGGEIQEDAPLMEVETDKAAVEIPSPRTGRIARWHVREKELVHVGNVMVEIAGDTADGVQRSSQDPGPAPTPATPPPAHRQTNSPTSTRTATASNRRTPASPSVRKLARTLGVELATVHGSGPGGRLTRADVEAAAEASQQTASSGSTTPTVVDATPAATMPVPATPVAPAPLRADIEGVEETNEYGTIVRSDLSQARKTIARVMSESWMTIPHVTDCNDADITDLESQRKAFSDPAAEVGDRRITTLAFVIRAVCRSLVKHPILNASIDWETQQVVHHRYVNIGIGIETARGLVAPVIRNAHLMGVGEIADQLAAITHNARGGTFTIEDTRGGTYTISNAGAMGRTRYSTPIITPGQVACLAVGRARKLPWVVGDEVVPRLILPLSHSMDHRLVDGGREIPFIEHVIDDLEHPMRFAL